MISYTAGSQLVKQHLFKVLISVLLQATWIDIIVKYLESSVITPFLYTLIMDEGR